MVRGFSMNDTPRTRTFTATMKHASKVLVVLLLGAGGCEAEEKSLGDTGADQDLGAEGSPCDFDLPAACGEGLRCQWDAPDGELEWTCVPHGGAAGGEECWTGLDCQPGLECAGTWQTSSCGNSGKLCTDDDDCEKDDTCIPEDRRACSSYCEEDTDCRETERCAEFDVGIDGRLFGDVFRACALDRG